jgi:hypothetical protein
MAELEGGDQVLLRGDWHDTHPSKSCFTQNVQCKWLEAKLMGGAKKFRCSQPDEASLPRKLNSPSSHYEPIKQEKVV